MEEMRIEHVELTKAGDVRPYARYLAEECKKFFQDPENEKAYQESLKAENDGRRRYA